MEPLFPLPMRILSLRYVVSSQPFSSVPDIIARIANKNPRSNLSPKFKLIFNSLKETSALVSLFSDNLKGPPTRTNPLSRLTSLKTELIDKSNICLGGSLLTSTSIPPADTDPLALYLLVVMFSSAFSTFHSEESPSSSSSTSSKSSMLLGEVYCRNHVPSSLLRVASFSNISTSGGDGYFISSEETSLSTFFCCKGVAFFPFLVLLTASRREISCCF
mmetsp:Transcript_9061/g.13720  ORF Transcript_9061/g.13720 Transcript_9061/m.13720 type:complete len:218 (-) Transcript_9061:269-922(-)